MNSSPHDQTNNNNPQPYWPKMIPNTYITHFIHRLNKPIRSPPALLHTNNSTINKSRDGHPPLGRNGSPRVPPQNKSITCPLPSPRNPCSPDPYTNYYRNYQLIYSTHSPSSTANCKYHCWPPTNSPYWRSDPSPTKY